MLSTQGLIRLRIGVIPEDKFYWCGSLALVCALRKHAYSNILKISLPKNWKFSDKNSDIFHISAQNLVLRYSLEPPRRGSSHEYTQSMLLSRNKKGNVYPCKPQFYYIYKSGAKGGQNYIGMFSCLSYKVISIYFPTFMAFFSDVVQTKITQIIVHIFKLRFGNSGLYKWAAQWDNVSSITKTCLYNFDPLKPHFYIVKLGFTGEYIIFLISARKHRLWVLVRTASARRF